MVVVVVVTMAVVMLVAVTPEIFIQGCPITYGNGEVHFYLGADDLQFKKGS